VAAQLVASQAVLSSTELVSYSISSNKNISEGGGVCMEFLFIYAPSASCKFLFTVIEFLNIIYHPVLYFKIG
jgi:hypothetical protein